VCLVLLDRLEGDPFWGEQVERVKRGEDALELARAYGNGLKRRRVIAELLMRPSSAIAYTVPATPPTGRDVGSQYSQSFWLHVIRGAECIVRLGGSRCLACGDKLAVTRCTGGGPTAKTARVAYCCTRAEEVADRDAMATVFSRAAAALGHR